MRAVKPRAIAAPASDMAASFELKLSASALKQIHANANRAAGLLRSMSNPVRLMVLCQLTQGEKSAGELERMLPISQSALSQHLALLRQRDLVKTRRAGQSIYYSLAGSEAASVLAVLCEIFCGQSLRDAQRHGIQPRRA